MCPPMLVCTFNGKDVGEQDSIHPSNAVQWVQVVPQPWPHNSAKDFVLEAAWFTCFRFFATCREDTSNQYTIPEKKTHTF